MARHFGLDPADRKQAHHKRLLERLFDAVAASGLEAVGRKALPYLQQLRTRAVPAR